MGVAYNSKIVTNGLVLCLDAGNRKSYPGSGTAWTDLSGRGNTGTLTNGPTYSSANGGSLGFDGLDDFGSVSSSQFQSGNNPLTMEVWFRWSGNGTNTNNVLFAYGNDAGAHRVPSLYLTPSKFRFEFGSSSGIVDSNTTIQTNTWYQGVGVYNNKQFESTTKVYINGLLENTTSYNSASIDLNGSNGQTAGIGGAFSSFGNVGTGATRRYGTFNGNIALIKYYNRDLTATEIAQNYNALKGRYGLS
jgi:hypothetical protein